MKFNSLDDFSSGHPRIEIRSPDGEGHTQLSEKEIEMLHTEVSRFLKMLQSGDYEEFLELLNGAFKSKKFTIGPAGYRKFRVTLSTHKVVPNVNALTDDELLENYWIYITKMGSLSNYFTGICMTESFALVTDLSTRVPAGPIPNVFPSDTMKGGRIAEWTSFDFDQSDPERERADIGSVKVVDVRLLLRTKERDIAYPMAIRFWWSTKRNAWTPWFLAQHNAVARGANVVF